jgi:mercuric ion transport protein
MKELIKQLASTAGAVFAGACCLGFAGALSLLAAVGAGFLVNDAFLIPLYLALLGLSVWLLHNSARAHGELKPFWTGLGAAVVAFAGLWTSAGLVYGGLAVLIASTLWDFRNARAARTSTACRRQT